MRQGRRSARFGFGKSAVSREIVGEVILKGRRHLWGDDGRTGNRGTLGFGLAANVSVGGGSVTLPGARLVDASG